MVLCPITPIQTGIMEGFLSTILIVRNGVEGRT